MALKLYKYRTLHDFKRFLEIIIYNKLYACPFTEFTDKKEGHYYYSELDLHPFQINDIAAQKEKLKICSASTNSESEFLWKNYADNYFGVAIGFTVDAEKYDLQEIEYIDNLISIDKLVPNTVKQILTKKLMTFKEEEEIRIFSNKYGFILIKIQEVIVGKNVDSEEFEFIKKLVCKINNKIHVKRQPNI